MLVVAQGMCRCQRLNKNHGLHRDFYQNIWLDQESVLCVGFRQCANAFGAQHFAHFPPIFGDSDRLQVGTESPRGGLLGPRAVQAKGGFLTTVSTFRHRINPFYLRGYQRYCIISLARKIKSLDILG